MQSPYRDPVPHARPLRLLDLYCGAGGAAMGYHRAGFAAIVGVDIEPQPRYPFAFVQAEALDYLREHGHLFDLVHASPPCQRWSKITHARGTPRAHPDHITPTRALLQELGLPYVIENVPGAPLESPVTLCGTMFGLRVKRHRLFETRPRLWMLPASCQCRNQPTASLRGGWSAFAKGARLITVAGHAFPVRDARQAMGIDWMTRDELAQAIPPAYTEWLGRQMILALQLPISQFPNVPMPKEDP